MNYTELIKKSLRIAWENKSYWILAFLINPSLFGVRYFNYDYRQGMDALIPMMTKIMIFAFIASLLFIFVSAIAQPALIIFVKNLKTGNKLRVGDSLKASFDYYWRSVLLAFTFLAAGLVVAGLMLLPIYLAFKASTLLGILASLIAFPIALFIFVVFVPILNYSNRILVFENRSAVDSITEAASNVLLPNKAKSLMLVVLSFGLVIAISFPISFLAMMVRLPFNLLSLGENPIFGLLSSIVTLIFILLSIPVSGFLGLFMSSLWTLGFEEIRKQPAQTAVETTLGAGI